MEFELQIILSCVMRFGGQPHFSFSFLDRCCNFIVRVFDCVFRVQAEVRFVSKLFKCSRIFQFKIAFGFVWFNVIV